MRSLVSGGSALKRGATKPAVEVHPLPADGAKRLICRPWVVGVVVGLLRLRGEGQHASAARRSSFWEFHRVSRVAAVQVGAFLAPLPDDRVHYWLRGGANGVFTLSTVFLGSSEFRWC